MIALCGLACSVFAAPNNQPNPDTDPTVHRDGCLTDHDAKVIMKRWVNFFVNFDPAVAQTGVTHGFKLISESANFLNPNFNFSLPVCPDCHRSPVSVVACVKATADVRLT